MSKKTGATLVAALLVATPALAQNSSDPADSVETLKRQLSAQQAINQQLKQRVDALERELAWQRNSTGPVVVGLGTSAPAPREVVGADRPVSAVEEALGSKGLVLLPVGAYRVTPSVSWTHSVRDGFQRDSYVLSTSLEAGLPIGMAISLRQPYVWRDYSNGNNSGWGDFSLGLAKKLNNETASMPSFVIRLGYSHNSGKDAFKDVPVGSGFRAYDLGITGVKRLDPLVVYGGLSHAHVKESEAVVQIRGGASPLFTSHIKPGNTYGLNMGVSLATTPDISLDAGLAYIFNGKTQFTVPSEPVMYGSRSATGYLNLGVGYLISRTLSLSISASAGLTKNANDMGLTIALPYRF